MWVSEGGYALLLCVLLLQPPSCSVYYWAARGQRRQWCTTHPTQSGTRGRRLCPWACEGGVVSVAVGALGGAYVLCAGAPDVWFLPFAGGPIGNGTGAGVDLSR